MKRVKFGDGDYTDMVSNLATVLGDEVKLGDNYAFMTLKSMYGNGHVVFTKISDQVSNLSFDAIFSNDFEVNFYSNHAHNIDFIYCLEGYLEQNFSVDSNNERINFRQNAIIGRTAGTENIIRFLSNIPTKVSVTTYNRTAQISVEQSKFKELKDVALKDLSDNFSKDNFRYFGRVCFKTALYADVAIKNAYTKSSDLLYKEAAILNTLASQLERYTEDSVNGDYKIPLRKSDIDKVIALESFICNNVSENLSIDRLAAISGLNPAKLQLGFNYLFNSTISSYIKDKRLDKAAQLIKETDYNVSELVYSIGFSSRSYFSKIFKQRYGVLPSKCVTNPNLLMAV